MVSSCSDFKMVGSKHLVSIHCFTYNHENYIKDALNGFTIQQTSFSTVSVIVDDASTDQTAKVIRKFVNEQFNMEAPCSYERETNYAHIIYAQHKKNKNCYFAVILLKENHYSQHRSKYPYLTEWTEASKYCALCEGDDYWTDPYKLQRQVDFLEKHPDYGLVTTAYREERNGQLGEVKSTDFGKDALRRYLLKESGIIATASTLFRTELYNQIDKSRRFLMGDVPTWIQLMHASKAVCLPEPTVVYRILAESASHFRNFPKKMAFTISALECREYYADKYGLADIALLLSKRRKKAELRLALYNCQLRSFFKAKPWQYGISVKDVVSVLNRKVHDLLS